VGTNQDPRENEKNRFPPSFPPNLKGKNARHVECMLGPSIGCMKFLFPKEFLTIFGLG
jgi:hypothetical protein